MVLCFRLILRTLTFYFYFNGKCFLIIRVFLKITTATFASNYSYGILVKIIQSYKKGIKFNVVKCNFPSVDNICCIKKESFEIILGMHPSIFC